MDREHETNPNFEKWRQLKGEELKERLRPKCLHWCYDGAGSYCKLRPQNPPVHGHTHYRTFCHGNKGPSCVEPDGYKKGYKEEE